MSGIDVEPVDEEERGKSDDGDHTIEVTPTDSVGDEEPAERETVDVEPSDEPIDGPDYVLYGGKGGVGKTTMAAATALDSARGGTSTLVVSTDPAHSLSDTFETEIPAEPGRIRDDIPLYAAEIDPETALEEGETPFSTGEGSDETDPFAGGEAGGSPFPGGEGDAGGPLGGLGDMLGGESPMDALFGGAMPGADEAAAMQLLLEYMDDPRFERVVVDTAPTGHTLRLLQLPEIMDTMMGRIMKLRQRLGGMLEGVKGMFGGDAPDDGDDLEDLEVLRERIERLRAALRDPTRTDFRIVMVPEEMSVFESKRLRAQLEEFGIPVGTVVVNRVMEPLSNVTDDVHGEFLQPNLEDCEFCQRRWDVQQSALAEAQELFRGTDVRRVPLFADEVRGEGMLEVVAACLR
ncbi:arsenite-activated ATPase ArsA [Natrinema pellirubrum DSM 15624]|uniref:Arsenite-activated ATPase ArsA n=1 Tax=Natrinema pellirubrum (strain DSM 15624 / CIP 106293 / JCM 10476 / NCIMB 786 / 157) TaxID=797303 RepID=L0JJ40_NATP1|nr:TRC40/GET3/ArsA family transport-energizing ATPase [Natrinema pellirubrum]AGB31299.1 arsenite-activated ATPase ArsA [Natrinema pellirubrum DSM 15624]ELY81764.1 arsenite-activated ATPase ArsA [Natrinema pellirubrum DSM 15624]